MLVTAVAVGYLAALSGTSAGRGLALVPHLATAHTAHAPDLVDEVPGRRVLTTLRADAPHTHGGHGHSHAEPEPPPARDSASVAPWAETIRVRGAEEHRRGAGEHRHGDEVHTHDEPPTERQIVVTVALDQHRVPDAAPVPGPLLSEAEALRAPEEALPHVDLSVETPPPLGRG